MKNSWAWKQTLLGMGPWDHMGGTCMKTACPHHVITGPTGIAKIPCPKWISANVNSSCSIAAVLSINGYKLQRKKEQLLTSKTTQRRRFNLYTKCYRFLIFFLFMCATKGITVIGFSRSQTKVHKHIRSEFRPPHTAGGCTPPKAPGSPPREQSWLCLQAHMALPNRNSAWATMRDTSKFKCSSSHMKKVKETLH